MIKEFNPHLVLVGMGVPLQEKWISHHWKQLPSAVYLGVGGVFNYLAGVKKRSPIWMRDRGFEWLFRFFQEPLRLGRRYTIDNLIFVKYFLIHLLYFLKKNVKKWSYWRRR